MKEQLKLFVLEYGLKFVIENLEEVAVELWLDFDLALNDFGSDEFVGCIHYDALPYEDGSVYCPNCDKLVIDNRQKIN
jgi:hypothetical protein